MVVASFYLFIYKHADLGYQNNPDDIKTYFDVVRLLL